MNTHEHRRVLLFLRLSIKHNLSSPLFAAINLQASGLAFVHPGPRPG